MDLNGLPEVLTVLDVAQFLRVTDARVYGLIHAGRLRAYQVGSRGRGFRVAKGDLQTFLGESVTADKQLPRPARGCPLKSE